jgi:hypothetical protein
MPTIAHHLNGNGAVFGPDINVIMQDAYQRACNSVTASMSVKKVLAGRIFELTELGERDPQKLCHEALATLHVKGACD